MASSGSTGWTWIIIGATVGLIGGLLSLTGIGALCGIPMIIVAFPVEIYGVILYRRYQLTKLTESIRTGIVQGMHPHQGYFPPAQQGYAPTQQGYITCRACGSSNYNYSTSCWKCGSALIKVQPQQGYVPLPQPGYPPPSQQADAHAEQPITCPACGVNNPSGNKFCGNCAGPLSASGQSSAAVAPVAAPIAVPEVRRAVAPCPRCRETIWAHHAKPSCPRCGETLPESILAELSGLQRETTCQQCGFLVPKASRFCPKCGSPRVADSHM